MLHKIKYLINHKEVRNFANYYIFTIINAGISVVSISYLTKHILPEGYGMIGIYLSILFFLTPVMSFSAIALQAIEIVNLESDKYLEFRNSLISFILVSFSICFIFVILFSLWFKEYSFVIIMAAITGIINIFNSIHDIELFQYSQPTRFGLISTGNVLLGLGLTVLFFSFFDLGWQFRIIAGLLAGFIVLVVRFYYLSTIGSSFHFVFDKTQFKCIIRYGTPLILSVVASWVLTQSDRYFLLNYFSLKEVGLYVAATSVASFVAMINSNMSRVIYPLVYKKLSNKEGKGFVLKIAALYSVAILIITMLFCVGLYFFGHFFLGKKYLSAMPIIYIMCFAQSFFGIYTTTALIMDYFKMTKLKTVLFVLSAIMVIILSFVLIPIFGIYGPALASLLSFLFLTILSLFILLSLFKKHNIKQ